VEYKSSVAKDLRRLDRKEAKRVLKELEDALRADPDSGEPLRGRFKGLLKLRIGDYRAIYVRTDDGVLVLRIGHRKSVYR
jgi:mRNA interferase RelE/StbE